MSLDKNLQYNNKIKKIEIIDEIKTSFLNYAMSVIVSRALPDVRDGLKPVHRRIIYAMWNLNITHNKSFKKSARIVGEVIGKYHPHGDITVYDSMVRMAQHFSYRYPLILGHGNFGSIDGDPAAAMRYTEAKMSCIAEELIKNIDKKTVSFIENYDSSEIEPVYLPGNLPNLLINGASGIAVGMATNIPPHNLGEIIDGIIAISKNEKITISELMKIIKGPDFPTGALITAGNELLKAYETGHGTIIIRSEINIYTKNDDKKIIITKIPYQVNKTKLITRIAELVKNKTITGIKDIRDESNHENIRIILELTKETQTNFILNKLYKLTPLQINFTLNILALHNNEPKIMGLKDILMCFIKNQIKVIVKRSIFELNKIKFKLLILKGLQIALNNIKEIIQIIQNSENTQTIIKYLNNKFNLNNEQSIAILNIKLQKLTSLENQKIENEIQEIEIKIIELNKIINNNDQQLDIMINELKDIKIKYNDQRRSKIINIIDNQLNFTEFIQEENTLIMLTSNGYIKRILENTFKIQNKKGKGVIGLWNANQDILYKIVYAKNTDFLLFFTNKGKVYKYNVYDIQIYSKYSKGELIINLISINKDEKIISIIPVNKNFNNKKYFVFATKYGIIKKTIISEFYKINKTGKIAIKLKLNNELIKTILIHKNNNILLVNNFGNIVRFNESKIRNMTRNSLGVKGMYMNKNEFLIDLSYDNNKNFLLLITENGYAKKTLVNEYRISNRGTKGVKSMKFTNKKGALKFIKIVNGDENLLISTIKNKIIKISLTQIPILRRNTTGIKIIKLNKYDTIGAIEICNNISKE